MLAVKTDAKWNTKLLVPDTTYELYNSYQNFLGTATQAWSARVFYLEFLLHERNNTGTSFYFQFGFNGAIPAIFNMLTTSKEDSDERLGGTTALWMLSFDAINRALIKAFPSATDTLQRFAQDSDKKVAKASQGVLWEIETENRDLTRSGNKNIQFDNSQLYFD